MATKKEWDRRNEVGNCSRRNELFFVEFLPPRDEDFAIFTFLARCDRYWDPVEDLPRVLRVCIAVFVRIHMENLVRTPEKYIKNDERHRFRRRNTDPRAGSLQRLRGALVWGFSPVEPARNNRFFVENGDFWYFIGRTLLESYTRRETPRWRTSIFTKSYILWVWIFLCKLSCPRW